jgi:subtilisin family serine protease
MSIGSSRFKFAISFAVVLLLLTNVVPAQVGPKRPAVPENITPAISAETPKYEYSSLLSLSACGVDSLWMKHPEWDGRGVIVCVLDDGMDIGIRGLIKTSEGKNKVIDVQDLGGSGDIYFSEAERRGDELYHNGQRVLRGLNSKSFTAGTKYYYAQLTEKRYQNGIGDLNFNEKRDDVFGILVFDDGTGQWSAIVDGNADTDIADEQIVTTYRTRPSTFKLRAEDTAKANDGRYLTGAVNIFPDQKKITLFIPDGAHGTHVAGIAAGFEIGGQKNFHGIAPGAELVAIKFSDNTLGGITVSSSMQRAYEHVIKIARETKKPVVVNMSFGIGSEIEGQSVMDLWLDSLLRANPDVTVCVSAANDGPGLSNIGLPGSADHVITSAAILPDDTGRDLYGVDRAATTVFDFSSRGGELDKPDIATPGGAVSTVPDYVGFDRFNGTSMSSPYTAGLCASLISAVIQKYPAYSPKAFHIKRALEFSAKPIAGFTYLDQGFGVPNLPRAVEILSSWIEKNSFPDDYRIETQLPGVIEKGTAAFYRNGYIPRKGGSAYFSIIPIENGHKTRESFTSFNSFDLRSDADWLRPLQRSVYRRGSGAFGVNVIYDETKLDKPGLYTGTVFGYRKGESKYPAFELRNTVVIPYRFTYENNNAFTIGKIDLSRSRISRHFIAVPSGCAALRVSIQAITPDTKADIVFVDNDGRTFEYLGMYDGERSSNASITLTGESLRKGVIELVVKQGTRTPPSNTPAVVEVQCEALTLDVVRRSVTPSGDSLRRMTFSVTNTSPFPISVKPEFIYRGFAKMIDTLIEHSDSVWYPFRRIADEKRIQFSVSMKREDYNLFTDIALQIRKPDGKAAAGGGFDLRSTSIGMSFEEKDTTHYSLFFVGGYADRDKRLPYRLLVNELHEPRESQRSQRAESDKRPLTIYPFQTEEITLVVERGKSTPRGYRDVYDLLLNVTDHPAKKIVIPYSW